MPGVSFINPLQTNVTRMYHKPMQSRVSCGSCIKLSVDYKPYFFYINFLMLEYHMIYLLTLWRLEYRVS